MTAFFESHFCHCAFPGTILVTNYHLILGNNDLLILFHQFKGSTDGLRNDLQPYTVQSKVESHLPFGLEKMTSQELAYAWMATLLRPNSLLAQLRSHAISQGNKD